MANPLQQAVSIALTPARLTGRVLNSVARELTGGQEPPQPSPPPAPPRPRPRDLDDVAIARKVETIIFRDRKVAKGKVDVNVADGVVWLRGEVKTPNLVRRLEQQASEVPEVTGVENLLHLPKTPAPTRTDTPPSQRKTKRTATKPAARKVTPRKVTEEAPAPVVAEPGPREASVARAGRSPAPLGSHEETSGPDPARLDEDPAYNPTEPGLRDLKGG
jgi:hypothetical protein